MTVIIHPHFAFGRPQMALHPILQVKTVVKSPARVQQTGFGTVMGGAEIQGICVRKCDVVSGRGVTGSAYSDSGAFFADLF
jgi:hypothetical protein